MRRYHHTGIPTTAPRPEERYLPELKMYVSGYESSPFGIEWMRFDPDCDLPELVKTVPHIAFEVDNLEEALQGQEILIQPTSPAPGITVAFIVSDGAPVEFVEVDHTKVEQNEHAGVRSVVTDAIEPSARLPVVSSIAAAWLLSIGIDVFLHGGLLAHLYVAPSPFLLPAEAAFRRIPLGYLTFLILTVSLFWLVRRLEIRGFIAGFRVAALAGAVVWGALVLGLYSISTASLSLLIGWWIGQTVELAFAGGLLGAVANGVPLKRVWAILVVAIAALAAATVALQSLGLAPAMKVVP